MIEVLQKRALSESVARKRLLASVAHAKAYRRTTAKLLAENEERRARKRLALFEKLRRKGLAGRKLGKHKVPEADIDVQLGEDLSESFRGLKVYSFIFCIFFF